LQVLSSSVGSTIRDFYGPDVQVLADFILRCDKFFDCLNSRSFTEHLAKAKEELKPYTSQDDERFVVSTDNSLCKQMHQPFLTETDVM